MSARPNGTGRADLLRALWALDEAAGGRYADLLGFSPLPEAGVSAAAFESTDGPIEPAKPTPASAQAAAARPRLQASFFAVAHFDQRLESDPPEPEPEPKAVAWAEASVQPLRDEDCAPRGQPLPFAPLVRRERLWPRLRQSLLQHWRGGVDLPRLVQQVASRRLAGRVPQREQRSLGRQIVVLWDAADRLTPYFEDYRRLVAELHRLHGGVSLRLWRVHEGPDDVWCEWDAARVAWPDRWPGAPWHTQGHPQSPAGEPLVPPGSRLLLLSDLGELARHAGSNRRWRRALHRWDAAGVAVTAWVPHGPAWVAPAISALAEVHCLTPRLERLRRQRGSVAPALTESSAAVRQRQAVLRDELLTRASVCLHLAPELLRSLRQTLPALAAEPGVEALAWACQPLVRGSHVSRALSPEHAPDYRRRFAALDAAMQCEILRRITQDHASLGRSTETTEVLIWATHASPEARQVMRKPLAQATTWTEAWTLRMAQEHASQRGIDTGARQFAADLLARTGSDPLFVQTQVKWVRNLWALSGRVDIPAGLDLQHARQAQQQWAAPRQPKPLWFLKEYETTLSLVRPEPSGPPLGTLPRRGYLLNAGGFLVEHSDGSRWQVGVDAECVPLAEAGRPGQRLTLHGEQFQVQIEELACPDWADAWGIDQYGLSAVLVIQGVRQRMRYIPPGRFLMGSPEGVGHGDEHPQHEVLLTEGHWLADTPCTQALWMAVMGENPSKFQQRPGAGNHPVENVSWGDVETFLQRLAALLPAGCQPALPTEAQWEYAARAGTTTAYWWGDEPDDQRANWKQQHRETTPVDRYPPNPWGLHDVHGNVREWCLDYRETYASEPVRDPCGDLGSSVRAVRGGSWIYYPVLARSASRLRWHRARRYRSQGFRLALRSPSPVSGAGGPGQGGGTGGPATGAGRPGAGGALPRPQGALRSKSGQPPRKKTSR